MKRTKEFRIHHVERIKKARRFYWTVNCDGLSSEEIQKRLARAIYTPKRCSCFSCANWRKLEGVTMAEKRALIHFENWQDEE